MVTQTLSSLGPYILISALLFEVSSKEVASPPAALLRGPAFPLYTPLLEALPIPSFSAVPSDLKQTNKQKNKKSNKVFLLPMSWKYGHFQNPVQDFQLKTPSQPPPCFLGLAPSSPEADPRICWPDSYMPIPGIVVPGLDEQEMRLIG